jgi:phosphate starvation-inducible PhoH-like protein
MIERHFILDGIDPVGFYGAGNIHLQMLKKLHPKLRIVARDNVIKAMGDDDELERFHRVIELLKEYCNRYNSLNEEAIIDAVNGKRGDKGSDSNVIVYNINGRPIYPRTENQCRLVEEYRKNIHRHRACREGTEEPRDKEDYPEPPGSGSRRETGIPARRHARQD